MPNYAASVLAKGQAIVSKRNQAPEQRRKLPTVMELALKNQEYSIPNANDLRVSDKRPVEIYYQTKIAQQSGTTKAHNHTGTYGDSGMVELVYVTHVETFGLPRKIAQNNILTYQTMWNNLYEEHWRNLRNRHDDSALAFLIANRMQLAASVVNPQIASANPGTYNDTTYALEIAQDRKPRFMQMSQMYMQARNFNGAYDIVSDLQTAGEFVYQMNQGAGNEKNTAFQFNGASVNTSNSVISSSYPQGSVLIMPSRSFAGMYWNDGLNKSGVNAGENEIGTLGTAEDPFGSGARADVSVYTQRADTSGNTTGGNTQDIVDQYELALTIAYALPPLSVTGDSVVHLIGQAS